MRKITKENLKDIELYYHPKQKNGYIKGYDLYQHLQTKGLLEDCLTLENLKEIQELGLKEFNKYFKDKYVFGWKSVVQYDYRYLEVPYLIEHAGKVVLLWYWLVNDWDAGNPALRFRKPSKLGNSELSDPLSLETLTFRLEKLEDWARKLQA